MEIKEILDKIICGNCLTILRQLPDKAIDLVFFDPPYNVNKDYGVYKDNLPWEDYIEFMKNVITECLRISKRGIGIYLDWKHFKPYWQEIIPQAEPIIIYKRSSGSIFSARKIMQHHHVILTTATALIPTKSLWDDIRVYGEGYLFREPTFGHPAQTSLKATKRFIENFSEENEIVLDPFIGVGTSAVVCKTLNRHFIGIDINPDYCEIARKRLAELSEPLDKFVER
jgi:site-specific DNA-methyltransferase (adenine-specific)